MRFTRSRVVPVLLLALAGAGVVALQSPASAAVSTTTITAPLDGAHYFVDDTNSDPIETVTVTGTSDGTTGDTLDIRCFRVAESQGWEDGPFAVPVQADGTFSVEMPITSAKATCRLRAVPDSFASGDSLAGFTGPTITTEYLTSTKVASGPNAGMTYDFDAVYQGSKAWSEFFSAGRGGLYNDQLSYPGGVSSQTFWAAAAALPHRYGAYTSAVHIDGKNAFSPYTAQSALNFVDRPGAPALTYSAHRDVDTGILTIHETDPYVVCPSTTQYPPPSDDCPEFVSAGVRLERTYTLHDGDRQVYVRDVWRSTDGKVHSIAPVYLDDVASYYDDVANEVSKVGLKLGAGAFFTYPGSPTTYPAPTPLAKSLLIRDNNTAPDGDLYVPRGAATFDFPNTVEWEQNSVINLQASSFSVPADGSRLIRQSFVIGTTDAEVLAKARANQSRITPYRPDAWIKTPGAAFTGNDVYNTTGAGQSVYGTAVAIAIQNDGTRTDSFRIKGASSIDGFRVKYLAGGTGNYDITYAVTHGTYVKHNLGPGSRHYLRLVIRVPSANGQNAWFPISVTSLGNTYRKDVVRTFVALPVP